MTQTGEFAASAVGVTKTFGERTAVNGLDLGVRRGTAFGLLGPNGAGKTTTVRLLTGMLTPTSGEVLIGGVTVTPESAAEVRTRVGVQTDTELYGGLTVRENLRAWGELYGLSSSAVVTRTDELLEVLGLESRIDSRVGELSKGMRQKVAIARAVIHRPELLFLDEPTAGLDPEAAVEVTRYLTSLMRTGDMTLVICTHQLHGLEELCDDIGILVAGRLVASGSVSSLMAERWPADGCVFTVRGDVEQAARALQPVVGDVSVDGAHVIASSASQENVARGVKALVEGGFEVVGVEPERHSMQDLYFAMVGEASA